jgi:penicillin amidase
VWADVSGNIGWQVVGGAPVRKGWNGLLPVPGDGRFDWQGYLPIMDLPHVLNPLEEYFASANQDNIPPGYPHSLGLSWADPFRFARIQEVLGSGRRFALADMTALQQDEVSIPARILVPLLKELRPAGAAVEKAMEMLLSWDFRLDARSAPAAIYANWEKILREEVWNLHVPENARGDFRTRSLKKMIDWVTVPDNHFGTDPVAARDALLLTSLEKAVQQLMRRLGPDMTQWRYGQEKLHHILIRHILSEAVNAQTRSRLDVGPAPRGGNGETVNNTSNSDNQSSGASFRIIADLENWDLSLGTNSPGQSGDPASPHYRDLFELWARGKYFPVYFSRSKIEAAARSATVLKPSPSGAK